MHSRSSDSDPLASFLALLRPEAVFAKRIEGAGHWSVRYEGAAEPGFTVVLAGGCFLTVAGSAPVALAAGDFVFLPPGRGFTMASEPGREGALVPPTAKDLRHGTKSGPATLRMLGGYFRVDGTNTELLATLFPPFVHVRAGAPGAERLRQLVALIADEADADRDGREPIVFRLVEVLLVEALRFRPADAPDAGGLLAGLADPALARALRRVHDDVAHGWTVAELARAAGMSRAVFAERFARLVGMPPMEYVLAWRIAIAKDLLRRERPPLAEVAARIGYRSASAFSTAFTRHTGQPPSAFARAG